MVGSLPNQEGACANLVGVTDSFAARPPLDLSALAALAPTWQVEVLPETPSTNAAAADRARSGAPEGTVLTTEHQYAGRGRLDRVWQTPPRSAIAVSVILRPRVPTAQWTTLPLVAGVAVARTLITLGYDAGLKWPNDVLLRVDGAERKVCGILVERIESEPDAGGAAAVVGIGLNTSLTAEELPVETATSLLVAGGTPVDRTAVLVAVLEQLAAAYRTWLGDPAQLLAAYTAVSISLGREVRAELPGGAVLSGTAVAIDEMGRLVIAHGGTTTAVGAGDVVHARLA